MIQLASGMRKEELDILREALDLTGEKSRSVIVFFEDGAKFYRSIAPSPRFAVGFNACFEEHPALRWG